MTIWQILSRTLEKYENLANFDKENDEVLKSG